MGIQNESIVINVWENHQVDVDVDEEWEIGFYLRERIGI